MNYGSWNIGGYRLPEFGITEKFSDLLGQGRTAQGGSNMYGPISETALAPSPSNPGTFVPTNTTRQGAQPSSMAPAVTKPAHPTVNQSSGQSYQQQWEAAGKAGIAPVGYHGESGPSTQDLQSAIDEIYNPSYQYLDQAEANLRNDYPQVLSQIGANYDVNAKTLADQNAKGLQTIDASGLSATNRKEDALSAARRLYNELRQGYQQRFGGSTSAGQAANELANVEQQRQMGQTTRDYGQTMQQIELQRINLDKEFATQTMKLKYDTDQAKQTAFSDYQNKLLAITQGRGQLESAKAQAKLESLQTLRNQLYQISTQNLQFQQNLALQKSQAETSLNLYAKQLQLSGTGSATALQNYYNNTTTTPGSTLSIGGTQNVAGTQMTGQIAGTKKVDRYGNIYYI